MKKIIIIGASGHGKVVADIAERNGYDNIVFLDDNDSIKECAGHPVVGKVSEAINIPGEKIVAIGNAKIREKIQNNLDSIATLIHPQAIIGKNVKIGKGTVIMAGAVINSDSKIGEGCIINTSSSIDHDCIINNYVHVSVGAHLCGMVSVDKGTWIGAGAIVINNIHICSQNMVGAGAVVTNDIKIKGTYVGIPASKI